MLRRMLGTTFIIGALAVPAGADTTFKAGSLIIPSGASFQHDCGAVSMYGLMYNVLRANAWLEANRATVCPSIPASQTCKIEIYYSYKDTKKSPNRCTPTNLDKGPAYVAGPAANPYPAAPTPTDSDPKWTDGCDFTVFDPAKTPVRLVTNKPAAGFARDPLKDTDVITYSTSGKAIVWPQYGSKTVKYTGAPATSVHTVRYLGGPFVIADKDAATFLNLVDGTLLAKDSSGNTIDFAPFRMTSTTCSFGSTIGGYVRIHRAAADFTAPTPRVFTSPPPRLALLATDATSMTKNVANNILQEYLENAGLSFAGAGGCPPFGQKCPTGGTRGQIFDEFDFADLKNGKLAALDASSKPLYKMLWAPHWQSKGTDAAVSTLTTNERTAIANVATFLDGQAGLMAECHSIEAFEGAYKTASKHEQGHPLGTGQFQSCVKNATGGCSSTKTEYGFRIDNANNISGIHKNCSDPTLVENDDCMYFSYPGDPFAQPADYLWDADGGSVRDYFPNTATNSIYRPGVLPLISGVKDLKRATLIDNATARPMVTSEFATRGMKDSDATKSNILYMAGHDLTGSVAGTKVVLQTLLQLGESPIVYETYEVSRSSPIIATVSGAPAIVQGTFENVQPDPPTLQMTSASDAAAFRFPHVKGHLRAVATSGIDSAGTAFSDQTPLFDAANHIPTPNYTAGCSPLFGGTCRSVFTNLVGGVRPPIVELKAANLAGLGAAMAPTLTATEHAILVQRVLAGVETSPNNFAPKLGGVDRSTVAVIPTSLVAGTARPTMIYFGAADGMVHAVCASVLGPCDVLGRELWAFVPRTQLPALRFNSQRIEGAPRVADMFGDFAGTGTRSFRTIMMFQTTSGNAAVPGSTPAVYALDITNPAAPVILWEHTTPATRGAYELGQGLIVNAGKVTVNGVNKLLAFAQTNNGGTGGSGSVVTAINIETGAEEWQTGYTYPAPRNGANPSVPASGVPGGAVAVDTAGFGLVSSVVFGSLYGDIFQLDAATGVNRHAPNPLFRFSTDLKPFGAPLTLYAEGGGMFAAGASGGYVDLSTPVVPLWTGTTHTAVGVALNTPAADAPLAETAGSPYVPLKFDLGSGDKGFAQVVVIGNEIFVTTDSSNVNESTYGATGTNTGKVYKATLGPTVTAYDTVVSVRGGAGSVARSGTAVYASASDKSQRLGADAAGLVGNAVNGSSAPRVSRRLWLRTL